MDIRVDETADSVWVGSSIQNAARLCDRECPGLSIEEFVSARLKPAGIREMGVNEVSGKASDCQGEHQDRKEGNNSCSACPELIGVGRATSKGSLHSLRSGRKPASLG